MGDRAAGSAQTRAVEQEGRATSSGAPAVGRIRPWHLPPPPSPGEWMETFTKPVWKGPSRPPWVSPHTLLIFHVWKSLNKNLFWNISRIFPLWPRQKYCKSNLAQGKMSVVSWSELRVSGQGLWVLIPAWPLNHFEPFASHFVLAPVSNFPSEWFFWQKTALYKTGIFVKIDFPLGIPCI